MCILQVFYLLISRVFNGTVVLVSKELLYKPAVQCSDITTEENRNKTIQTHIENVRLIEALSI